MIRYILAVALIINTCTVLAVEKIPTNLTPIINEITLLNIPTHQAICVQKTREKNSNEFFAKNKTSNHTITLSQSLNKKYKYNMNTDIDGYSIDVYADINGDGSGFSDIVPKIQFNNLSSTDEKEIEKFQAIFEPILSSVLRKSITNQFIGKPLRQQLVFETKFCDAFNEFPLITMKSKLEKFSVKGISLMNARESVVFEGTSRCELKLDTKDLVSNSSMWFAIDKVSGLESERHTSSIITFNGVTTTSDEDVTCLISGAPSLLAEVSPQNTNTALKSENNISATQKLTELKTLLDKNLITKEMFEKKRIEIMKAF